MTKEQRAIADRIIGNWDRLSKITENWMKGGVYGDDGFNDIGAMLSATQSEAAFRSLATSADVSPMQLVFSYGLVSLLKPVLDGLARDN